jgi:hypothetical protein
VANHPSRCEGAWFALMDVMWERQNFVVVWLLKKRRLTFSKKLVWYFHNEHR